MASKRTTTFRLDADLEARIEAIRDAAARRTSGPFANRPEKSTVLRALLEAGANVYEAELGIVPSGVADSEKAPAPAAAPAPAPTAPVSPKVRRTKRGA